MVSAFGSGRLPVPAADEVRRVVGLSLNEALSSLAPEASTSERLGLRDAYRTAFAAARTRTEEIDPLFPGAIESLEALSAAGYTLGIATGKSMSGVRATLSRAGLEDRFATLQTSDDAPSKPDPAMLLRAMAQTDAAPSETIMVGDTTYDMTMARNAGTAAIGVAWGYHAVEDLRRAGAQTLVEDFAALPGAVARLMAFSNGK